MTEARVYVWAERGTEEQLVAEWVEAVRTYGTLARARADAEIRGARYPRFDGQGLDALSAQFGEIRVLQRLVPYLADPVTAAHPLDIQRGCREDAVDGFKRELLEAA